MMNGVPEPERQPSDPMAADERFDVYFERLSAFLDGELSPDEARDVQDWLIHDPEAQALYRQLSSIQAGFDRLDSFPNEADLDHMISTVIRRTPPAWRYQLVDSNVLPHTHKAAAALVVFLGLSLATFQQWFTPQLLVSVESPPVQISRLPPSTRAAEHYLLGPSESQDPYAILFAEGTAQ
jgi:anti-sigma factor RsiW